MEKFCQNKIFIIWYEKWTGNLKAPENPQTIHSIKTR